MTSQTALFNRRGRKRPFATDCFPPVTGPRTRHGGSQGSSPLRTCACASSGSRTRRYGCLLRSKSRHRPPVISDGLVLRRNEIVGADYERVVTGGGKASTKVPQFKAVNAYLGNHQRSPTSTLPLPRRTSLRQIRPGPGKGEREARPRQAHPQRCSGTACAKASYVV